MSNPSPTDYRYWAFISYSSKDKAWAQWLHHAIETYGIPAELVDKHQTPTGHPVPKRIQPVFRDRDELPAAFDLGTEIEKSLHASRYLIVVCSPHAAASQWVNREIEVFQELGRAQHILAIIVAGEPNAGNASECFPPSLRKLESIAADARPEGDGKTNAKLKLLAGMLGVSFDSLKHRDAQRRIRHLQKLIAISLLVVVSLVALAVYALSQRQQAEAERNHAQIQRDRAEKTLGQLHDTAPTYYEQAQMLIEQRQWSNALQKASIAVGLASERADFQALYGNLLQTELRMAEARDAYAAALERQPDHKLAKENLELCETFLSEEGAQHRLAIVNRIEAAMLKQGRVAEAGAFTRFIQQASTDQNEAVNAWSNVLVSAGFRVSNFRYDGAQSLVLMSTSVTNDTLGPLQGMPINCLSLGLHAHNIRDLSPLHGMPLYQLLIHEALISDLSPLQGMRLRILDLARCKNISDLTPLRGMPLETLNIEYGRFGNLSPLAGMPLTKLAIAWTKVADLTPLAGMQLKILRIGNTKVNDLSPLRGMPLNELAITDLPVNDLSPLKGMPLQYLNAANIPVKDLSPLQGMPLVALQLSNPSIDDLAVLKGLPLKELLLGKCSVTDLSPLRGMPLKMLYLDNCAKLQDLTPLADCQQLETLTIPTTCKSIECLRSHPTLKNLGYKQSVDQHPLPTVAEFWKAYDAQKSASP